MARPSSGTCIFKPCGRPVHVAKLRLCSQHYHLHRVDEPLRPLAPRMDDYFFDEESRLRECTRCGEIKSFDEFNRHPNGRAGLNVHCRECVNEASRERGIRRKGLSREQYDSILEVQGGSCAICGVSEPGGQGRWHIDHDHRCCPGTSSCGKCVRGLLCHHCNTGLGKFRDSEDMLMKAIEYLRRDGQTQ